MPLTLSPPRRVVACAQAQRKRAGHDSGSPLASFRALKDKRRGPALCPARDCEPREMLALPSHPAPVVSMHRWVSRVKSTLFILEIRLCISPESCHVRARLLHPS